MTSEVLPLGLLEAIAKIVQKEGFDNKYILETSQLAGIGENSYGLVLQAKISCPNKTREPFFCVLKIAPSNPARRIHMRVADYYKREAFMYNDVLRAFQEIQEEERIPVEEAFNAIPKVYHASLKDLEEFFIFEDLIQGGFSRNSRSNLPTFELAISALKALAKYHAMSFVIQAKKPELFQKLIGELRFNDNLYTPTMDQVTIEFAKKYVRRTKEMIADDKHRSNRTELMKVVQIFEDTFKEIGLRSVDGGGCAPYAVICHGDFWNNNVLYRYDECNNPIDAKLIDFQMSRYASPVLDIVHYLFACTEKELRDAHFDEFINVYHATLTEHLRLFNLDPEVIFPRSVLNSHLKTYGPYGFCMAIFSVPFFICDSSDLPDLDEVSEAIHELSSEGSDSEDRNQEQNNNIDLEMEKKSRVLVEEFELLNEKTTPLFKKRLTGIVLDLVKYDMVDELVAFGKKVREEKMTAN
ncbi:uncharacterized protein LOC129918832 [Episyrphus balteatus]|uniref:uncharacterized protein LOC129918832 n=1 Tax=Episyrphus balteatus TaxID=286459 RepID=UPI0024860E38|nr:uncharacterized protein LOC129918832 [Episyrphus balteatus]